MATSYGVSQLGILEALMSGKTKSDIYDTIKEKKEKLFEKGVKPSQIEKMDKLFDKRFDNAMSDFRYKLKNRPGMKEYRKKQRSAPASDTGSEFSKGGLTGGQKKLDKNKNNRIDAEDFKILRGQGKSAMKARLGSRVPPVIRPKPTAGGKPLTPKPIKPKPKPKMGGGMMKKYSKGGGADTGTAGERRSKLMTAVDRFKRRIDVRKRRPKYIKPPERKSMVPADVGQVAQSLTPTGLGKQMGRKVMGKMGGGMMMKPMGYKSGTSVKVKCKLGRNKPTKMY